MQYTGTTTSLSTIQHYYIFLLSPLDIVSHETQQHIPLVIKHVNKKSIYAVDCYNLC